MKQLLREATGRDSKLDVYASNHAGQNAIQCALQFRYKELADYLASKLPLLQPAGVSAAGRGGGEVGASVPRQRTSSVAGAAMLIQRAFRCHAARLCYYLLLGIEDGAYEEEAVERTAATIIQQAYRAFLARSYYFEL